MRTHRKVNETRVIAAYIGLNSLINIIIVLINAFFIHNTFISQFMLGYSTCLLVTAIVQAVITHINNRLLEKDAEEYLQKMLAAVKEAQEKVKENEKEGK